MKNVGLVFCLLFNFLFASSQLSLNKDYFDRQLPSNTPIPFAIGVVSDGLSNRDFTISPLKDEIFYTIQNRDLVSAIMHVFKKNGRWSQPEVASFSGIYNDLEATFTADGKKILFSSNRPISSNDSTRDYNIWFVEEKNGSWSQPIALSAVVNTEQDEFYPSVSKSGNLYFTSQLSTGKGKEDIFMCKWENGEYKPPVSLPDAINSKGYEFNAFVDPDEQFIIFTGYGRSDDLGKGDLYMSVKKDGDWMPAVNLGKEINSGTLDYCPFVSWDKKYLFFTSSKTRYRAPFTKKQTTADLKKGLQSAGNGLDDIYWVRFDSILATK